MHAGRPGDVLGEGSGESSVHRSGSEWCDTQGPEFLAEYSVCVEAKMSLGLEVPWEEN